MSQEPATTAERDDRMPSGIPFIISNEFAERFCFYGISSILAVYLASHLHFTQAKAAEWQSNFKVASYAFPVLGAVVSDVLWGKFRTIMVFSVFYMLGCAAMAIFGDTPNAIMASLFFVALGTGGIKPCVSTNVGDQFSGKNAHLIEKAFSWFYFAINAGSSISIFACPFLLDSPKWGPHWAFGLPAAMMAVATVAFYLGRNRFVHAPPAGKAWADEVFSRDGLKLVLRLAGIYAFVMVFWMLWDQSNGNTWTLQAASVLMDKHIWHPISFTLLHHAFAWDGTLLPGQVQVVNGFFVLGMIPIFTYGIYPLLGRFFTVTPLRKIGMGLFVTGSSYLIVGMIEARMQNGQVVSVLWQMLAYAIVTAGEILVSITALEFSYKQAPLRLKSFVMSLFLLTTSFGNFGISAALKLNEKPLHATAIEAGDDTRVKLDDASQLVKGQKLDITNDGPGGVTLSEPGGKSRKLEGTFLVGAVDPSGSVQLLDIVTRAPLRSAGAMTSATKVSTYHLVGPMFFYFFFAFSWVAGVVYIFFAMAYKEQTFVRSAESNAAESP